MSIALRNKISEGLAAWLTFEYHSGREKLFNERYLAFPLSQILTNNLKGDIEGESNHPVLTQAGKRGRPPQLDFVVKENNKVIYAIETKWAGASGIKVEDIIWDCVRLELAAHHYNCETLFILAGERSKIDNLLASKAYNPLTSRRKPSPIMALNGHGRLSVNVQTSKKEYGKSLRKILNSYPGINFPRSYVCGSGICLPRSSPKGTAFGAAVWNIRPENTSKRFVFKL